MCPNLKVTIGLKVVNRRIHDLLKPEVKIGA